MQLLDRIRVATVSVLVLLGFGGTATAAAAVRPSALSPTPTTPKLVRQSSGLLTGSGTVIGTQHLIDLTRKPHRGRHGGDPRARQSTAPDPAGNSDPVPPPSDLPTSDRPGPAPLEILRQSTVISGSTNVGLTAEPVVANDRHVTIVTGNDFAGVSTSAGVDAFSPLDPTAFDALGTRTSAAPGDKYTSDQAVIALDRGSSSLLVWVLMNSDASASDGDPVQVNSIRVVVFRNAQHLIDNRANPVSPSVCQFAFTTATLGRPGRNIDFPRPVATDRYLYITANIRKIKRNGERDAASSEGAIMRMPIDDLASAECRSGFRVWHDSSVQNLSGVEGAGSTMYFARHRGTLFGDTLRIYAIKDSSTTLTQYNRNITNFDDSGAQKCPIGTQSDPCRFDERVVTGFRSGSTVGWMWTAPQHGNSYPYPYVKVATFDTSGLELRKEASLWSPDYAWTFPAAAVNARGDVGVLLYRMGGSTYPEARAFVVPASSAATSWPPPTTTPLASSTHPPAQSFPPDLKSQWGDYSSLTAAGGCPNTFLGVHYTLQNGSFSPNVAVQTSWFGDRADACADLEVSRLTVPSQAIPGASIIVNDETRNVGSGTSRQSRTALYLSDDESLDAADIRLDDTHFVPELAAGAGHTKDTQVLVSPFLWEGGSTLYVIACADDRALAQEVTETNNCRPSQPISVLFGGGATTTKNPLDARVQSVVSSSPKIVRTGARVSLQANLTGSGSGAANRLAKARVRVTLSPRRGPHPGEVRLAIGALRPVRSTAGATPRRTVTISAQLPRRLAAGDWYLRVCVVKPPGAKDARRANDCRTAAKMLTVSKRP